MAAFATGIFNHATTAAQALTGTGATPMASSTTDAASTSSTSSSSSTISANDFLTLLVTEMQNQDPTADTDPNEYINQLVNVNSLEQLIDINQNLSTALGTSSASSATGQAQTAQSTPAAVATPAVASSAGNLSTLSSAANRVPGNLSIPEALPASQTVAHALDGQSRTQSIATAMHQVQ
jgi:flagellar basal-body rod modification protein FlgD